MLPPLRGMYSSLKTYTLDTIEVFSMRIKQKKLEVSSLRD